MVKEVRNQSKHVIGIFLVFKLVTNALFYVKWTS